MWLGGNSGIQTKSIASLHESAIGGLLVVDFRQPRTLVMLWFESNFGTNPPLGILMI
jgi:hypothetical protein